jgi:hypothetical protein
MVDVLPGDFGIPSVSALYAEGVPLASLSDGLATQRSVGQTSTSDSRFWASPPRLLNTTAAENLVVTLTKPKLMNYVSLDLPKFPHHFYIHYWDAATKTWKAILGDNGYDIRFYIDGSVPHVVGAAAALQQHMHPSHYGADHWVHFDADTRPFTASKIRFQGTRLFGSTQGGPVTPAGKPAPYSLGIRNLDFGYRVRNKEDVPLTNRKPDIITERESFTTVTDILGSPVELSMRENRASDLVNDRVWKSGPQPFNYAVVNLYVDSRDSAGAPQVIDSFDLTPVTSGVRFNLYYSSTPPDTTTFGAVDTPLGFPFTRTAGVSDPIVINDGLKFPDEISYLDIDNQGFQWRMDRPFWIGLEILPQFDSTDTDDHIVFDSGPLQLAWRDQTWQLTLEGTGSIKQQQFDFSYNERLYFVVSYDATNIYFFIPEIGTIISNADLSHSSSSALRLGAESGVATEDMIATGAFTLRTLVLKQETASFGSVLDGSGIPAGVVAFVTDASDYVQKPQYAVDDDGSTDNALLRFDVSFTLGTTANSGLNPFGFVGGPGAVYEDVAWTPISRDFILRKGSLKFDPVVASCFKFEFSQLAPMPYDLYTPVSRKVQMWPAQVVAAAAPAAASSVPTGSVGSQVTTDTAPLITYADTVSQSGIQPTSQQAALPTEALHATDPVTAQRLLQFGGMYQFQPWQSPTAIPRFTGVQQHFYETVEVLHTSRVAYFVSIAKMEMFRVDYANNDDTEMYLELFGDRLHLNVPADPITTWDFTTGMLRTPHSLSNPVTATSVVFSSKRQVRGIQLATQQSDAIQLLFDPDFQDPLFRAWEVFGDAAPLALSDEFNSSIGSTVQITRRNNGRYWDTFQTMFPTWDALEGSNSDPHLPTWDDLEGISGDAAVGGISYSTSVSTTAAGRIYAAARVYAATALTQPLILQIVDQLGGVVAEAEQDVSGGEVTEWFVGYTIGEGDEPELSTWDDIEALGDWNDIEGEGTWDALDFTIVPLDGELSVRLIQRGNTSDEWFIDNLSLFEDAIVWEFSNDGGTTFWPVYDIRNDPHGVFIFPVSASAAPSAGRGLVWRATGYRPGLHLSAVAIRPWYGSLNLGIPCREPGVSGGPNLNPTDHFPKVADDPRWQAWHEPIPQDWWFRYRQLFALSGVLAPPIVITTPATDVWLNEHALVAAAAAIPDVGPEIYEDLYSDGYPGHYGVEGGGDVYTDEIGNNTY